MGFCGKLKTTNHWSQRTESINQWTQGKGIFKCLEAMAWDTKPLVPITRNNKPLGFKNRLKSKTRMMFIFLQ